MAAHKLVCPFKPVACLQHWQGRKCAWKGSPSSMAKHLKESHGIPKIDIIHRYVPFLHRGDGDSEWALLFEGHGETFLCSAKSGKDYLPLKFSNDRFSVTVRCLNPAACNKFSCTYSITEPGTAIGLTRTSRVDNESIDALIKSGNLFRIDEETAIDLSRKQYPNENRNSTMRGRRLNVKFEIKEL
jgi:hypothetical protein